MLDRIIATWQAYPLAGPGLLIGLALGAWLWRRSRGDLLDRLGVAVLALWVVFSLATAFSPPGGVLDTGAAMRGCSVNEWVPLSPTRWFESSSYAISIWYCVPGGLAAALVQPGRRRRVALAIAAAVPIVCELGQLLLPMIRRVCASVDLVNNWTGIAVGAAIGLAVAAWWRRSRTVSSRTD